MKYKLGKLKAVKDPRTLKLALCLQRKLPDLPAEYSFDATHGDAVIPTPMFLNDRYGCCVIAGRAHQTLRLEHIEQDSILDISDSDILHEYFAETGGDDTGLVMLDSLKSWRAGWLADGYTYRIDAFASVAPTNRDAVRYCIYLLHGMQTGLWLPVSAQDQFDAGKPWTPVKGPDGRKGSLGGHCVYVFGYDDKGLVCVTWGKVQRMSWPFFERYCDEAYGIVDQLDEWVKKPGIDVAKMREMLLEVQHL